MPYVLYVNGLNRLPKNVRGPDAGPDLSGRLAVGRCYGCLSSPRRPRARAPCHRTAISWLFDCHVSRQVVSSRPLALTLLPREVNRRLHKQKGIGPRRSLLRHKLDITMSMATVFARRFAAGQVRSHKPGF